MATVERTPSSQIPTAYLVKPEPAWPDFLGPRGISQFGGLLLQPGLFLSASRVLLWETWHPPKGLRIPWLLQVPGFEDRRARVCQKGARRTRPIVRTVLCRVGSKGDVTGRTTDCPK